MVKYNWYWHVHHDKLIEKSGNINDRLKYILGNKPEDEIPLRLRLLRKVKDQDEVERIMAERKINQDNYLRKMESIQNEYDTKTESIQDGYVRKMEPIWNEFNVKKKSLDEDMETLHHAECPNCPWNGMTIFW